MTTGTQHPTPDARAKRERNEEDYVIRSSLRVLKVLECLEGRNFEPVTIDRAAQRAGCNRSAAYAALITLKKAGWAKEIFDPHARKFILGPKGENLARQYAAKLVTDPQSAG